MKNNMNNFAHLFTANDKRRATSFLLRTLSKAVVFAGLIPFIALTTASAVRAQVCPTTSVDGGNSIAAQITNRTTGAAIADGAVVPAYTEFRIDSLATAYGNCHTGCTDYPVLVNHTNLWADISTTTGWNGTYTVGYVFGLNPNGTTAFYHELDSHASNSTGPTNFTALYPGSYTFHIQAVIDRHPNCSDISDHTGIVTMTVYVGDTVDTINAGDGSCNSKVAEPINVTNGNMYLSQTDYRLPALGAGLEMTRTYNSQSLRLGMFGHGWSTQYDESLDVYGSNLVKLNLADGRIIYFTTSATNTYVAHVPVNFYGQIVKDGSGYNLTFKDGRVHRFSLAGKLLSQTDRNGNQTVLTYGSNGEPATITDPFGRAITLAYNSDGQVTSITDALGIVTTYTYDWTYYWSNWVLRLRTVTYADGSQFKFSYDYPNKLTTVKDALDNVLESHTYDSQDRALTSEVAGNGAERYTLNYVSATETDVTDALNHVTKYFFDTSKGRNVVTRVEGSCSCGNSQIQTWTYDNQLNVTSKTDALNHTTSYTYDTSGNLLTETNTLGTTSYSYNSSGDLLTRTDPMNGIWTNTYSAQGNQLTAKDPLNHTTTFTYDTRGLLLTATDPRNYATTLTYDANGNPTRWTDALSNQTNITYDARGRITSVTNALNQVTNYEYDLAGRLKKIIYPDTNFVLFTYDLAGRRTKIKDPRGYETNFAYDSAYRLTSETNADGKVTSYAYDLMSNRTGVTDALNRTTNYTYDDLNRLTKIKYPEASAGAGRLEENFAYDLAGNLTQKTDQAGRLTTFTYDNANRLTSTTDPALEVTAYEYNARSQQTAIVDALNQRYEFVYDPLNRVTQEKKGTATKSFVYDAAGNRTQRTDYNSAVTTYAYDSLNRLTTISYPDTTSVTYGYDALSRLMAATNPNGTVAMTYDNRGRVSSVTDVFGQVAGYAYDANGNRTQLSLGGVTNATYQYDMLNRLTQLTDATSLNTTFTYDATDQPILRTLPNGVVTTSQYDGLNRLTRLTHAKSGNSLADFQYQFNAVSSITQMIDGAGTHNYTYDTRDRLTAASHPNQTNENYTLDDVGNRAASHEGSSYSYQTFNRLVTANANNYTYDTNGNLISKTNASDSWTYTWDYENRLKQASKSGGITVTYSYDALGRRIQRTSTTGGTTKFVYDSADVLRDLDGNGNTIADYLNGPGIDNKLRQTSGGTSLYFIQDHLATTRALADANGSVVTDLTYDSFGNQLTGSGSTRYHYTGRETDTDTGFMYYRARWYDAQQGRFISEDPIGFDGGLNLYGYVENNPMSLSDPSGLCPPDRNKVARCAALVRRMLRPLEEMKRLLPNYDPAKDFFGGYPISKRLPNGRIIDLGKSKPGGHYQGLRTAQKALFENLEDFKRECLDRNDNSNPGLPSDAEEYAYKRIEPPFDPNAPDLFDRIRDWWHNLPPLPTQRELQRSCPWCLPPPILPFPIPVP